MIDVSIIVPCYNVSSYISEAIDSLKAQNFQNKEVIFVDDGSTDQTVQIIQRKIHNLDYAQLIRQQNEGPSVARNTGLKIARGKYIYFFDSDDVLIDHMLDDCFNFAEANNLDVVHFNCKLYYEDMSVKASVGDQTEYFKNTLFKANKIYDSKSFCELFSRQARIPPWFFFIKREVLTENDIQFMPNILNEDELFTPELLINCQLIGFLEHDYLIHRMRANSIMTVSNRNAKQRQSRLLIIQKLNLLLKENHSSRWKSDFLCERLWGLISQVSSSTFDKILRILNQDNLLFIYMLKKAFKLIK
ncbi:glycosyltransferase [Agrilactobacillus fermenti]|uniref:glycosyltransferase n=1 Tax=Agrilactobacillus fermenti TaxID=2586909 RepID=UPI001E2F027C|nr:glycosyltransferase [Agrilactobacillus fermenti]MCD2255879.1 glycosyltransferase [Agrilactobacillus fermenti]